MDILLLGNELLRQKAETVRKIGPGYIKIASDLIQALHDGDGVGLAGPQVGFMERIFAVHIHGDEARIFINPSIIETSQDTIKYEEGCLSIPGYYADVVRPKTIKIQAWNEKGRPFTLEASGMLARVIQHEYDHLDGTLFIDHISEAKRKRIIEKMEKAAVAKAKDKSAAPGIPERKA
ncbi:peptide deformylase [Leadbettera azotonutricia]|uniref:Peptide deformylase n=1 Tax=Leadbettera azotonutricia (strain ATCC BAA-888 / DSM 13862 / ZAS-9) TaxID=545695 RepID=F5Y9W9_LEAAZ|nr:peptide deformylase [Leadbettera azotonutricia]AEF81159.1 peptide deformylase [Leadbettera azotonutricia ZAS-9]